MLVLFDKKIKTNFAELSYLMIIISHVMLKVDFKLDTMPLPPSIRKAYQIA